MTGNKALALGPLRRLSSAQVGDAELLERFLTRTDADAFAELVRRYGPMVLGVCRRALGNGPDADDAFQAAFLVLARKGGSVRNGNSVASWLFGVARFVALRARDENRRRREHEARAAREPRAEAGADPELLEAVDEELQRLPDRYRAPLVTCLLRGRTQDEAAEELGCSLSTLRRRLEKGQDLLRRRLNGRGITPALGVLTVGAAQVSPAAVEAATALVVKFINGEADSVPATALAKGAIAMIARPKLKVLLMGALALAGLIGGGVVWSLAAAQQPEPLRDAPPAKAPEKPTDPPAKEKGAKVEVDKIKPGDWLKIVAEPVFERAPLSERYQVAPSGKVALPETYGEPIKIDGLTLEEASAVVQKQMLQVLRKCEVKITRTTPRSPPRRSASARWKRR
jgi:RNA polymerase sigma factor (sigma-70 family)